MNRVDCVVITSGNDNTPSTRIRVLDIIPFFEIISVVPVLHKERMRIKTLLLLLQCKSIMFQKVFPNFLVAKLIKFFGWKLFFDIDDAIYLKFSKEKRREFNEFLGVCDTIFCGNKYLAQYINSYNSNTIVIPTGVNKVSPPINNNGRNVVTIGWTGTRANFRYLEQVASVFTNLSELYKEKLRILIVSDERPNFKFPFEFHQWSIQSEKAALSQIDIGVMPLDADSEWVKGKCAFKMLLYMSYSIPTVSTRIGANAEIITDGVDGLLVNHKEEWEEALNALIIDSDYRFQIGQEGYCTCQKFYLKESIARKLEESIILTLTQ